MGVISQLLELKGRKVESVHEKESQIMKAIKEFAALEEQEKRLEESIRKAASEKNADMVTHHQKEMLRLVVKAMKDVQHLLVETFGLVEHQRGMLHLLLNEANLYQRQGLTSREESQVVQQAHELERQISDFFRSTRMTAGLER